MALFAFGSLKGAPGTTTAVLALASVWPGPSVPLVVEADPDGGSVADRFGLDPPADLTTLGAAGRRAADAVDAVDHAAEIPGGLGVVCAPREPDQTAAALTGLDWPQLLRSSVSGDVLVDCGRIAPRSPAFSLLSQADVALVVLRPVLDQIRVAAVRWPSMSAPTRGLLLVGEGPYARREVGSALGTEAVEVLADDPRGAAILQGRSAPARHLVRSALIRSARPVAEKLASGEGGG